MSSQGTVSDGEETRDIVADNLGAIKKQIFDTNRFASMWHEAKNEMNSLKAEVEVLRQQLAAPRECDDCPILQDEIKTLKADLVKAKKDSSAAKVREATKKAKAAAEEAVARLTEELKLSQDNLHLRESELAQEQSRSTLLQSEIEQLKFALAARPTTPPPLPAVDDSIVRRMRKEIDSLQRNLKDAQDANKCVQNDFHESTRDLESTKAQLRSLRAECNELKTQLVAATTAPALANTRGKEEIKQLRDDKKLLEFELKGARAQLATQLEQLASNDAEISDLRVRMQEMRSRVSTLERDHDSVTKTMIANKATSGRKVVQLEKQLKSVQEQLEQASRLQADLKQAEEQLQEAQATVESLKERLKSAEERARIANSAASVSKGLSAAMEVQSIDSDLVNTLNGKVEELLQKVKDKDQQISMLMSFLDTANKEKEELRSKQKKLKQELSLAQLGSTATNSRSISPISSPVIAPLALPPPSVLTQPPTPDFSKRASSPPPRHASGSIEATTTSRSRKRKIVETSDSDADTSGSATVSQTITTKPSSSAQLPATKRKRSAPAMSSAIPSPTSSPPPDAEMDDDKPATRSTTRKRVAAAVASSKLRSSPEPANRLLNNKLSAAQTTTSTKDTTTKRRTGPSSTSSMDILEELGPIPKRARSATPIVDKPTPPPPPPPVIRSASDLIRVASNQLSAILSDLDQYVSLVQANVDGFLNAVNSWLLSFGSTAENAWSTQCSSNMLCIPIPGASSLRVNLGYPEQEFPLAVLIAALVPAIPGLVKALVSRMRRSLCFYRIALVCPTVPTNALRAHFLDSLISGSNDFKAVFNNTLIFRPSVLPGPADSDFFSQCVLQATVCAVKSQEIVNILPHHVREWFASAAVTERGNVLAPLLNPTSDVFKELDAFTLFKCLQLCPLVADTPRDSQALVSRLLFAASQLTAPNTVLLMLRGVDFALNRSQKKPWTPSDADIAVLQQFATSTSRNYTHDILASILTHVKAPQDQRRVAVSLSH